MHAASPPITAAHRAALVVSGVRIRRPALRWERAPERVRS